MFIPSHSLVLNVTLRNCDSKSLSHHTYTLVLRFDIHISQQFTEYYTGLASYREARGAS